MEMKMRKFMDGYYADMKKDNGIDPDYGIKKEDSNLVLMLNKVKPPIEEKTFEDYLSNETKKVLGTCKVNRKKSLAKKALLQQ